MATSTKRFGSSFWIFSLCGVAAVFVVFAILFLNNKKQVEANKKETDTTALAVLKLDGMAVERKLAAKFTDADGDLVADTPMDVSKQVDPATLTFSYVATEDAEAYAARWKNFTDYLATVTGKPVEYALYKRTDEELAALKEGKLLVAGFNSGAVPAAVCDGGFVPAYTLGVPEAGPTCEIIVPADSAIAKPEDLRGKSIALVDFNSNTGYKAPISMLKLQYKMVPPADFDFTFSYGHEASIKGIADKHYAAAAVASDMLERAVASKAIGAGDFKVIYKSEQFPTAALGFAYNLKPELQAKIRKAFETYAWPAGPLKAEFGAAGQDKFTPTNYKKDWAGIRTIESSAGGVK